MSKLCPNCTEVKPLKAYSKSKQSIKSAWCKSCSQTSTSDSRKTFVGLSGRMYDSQKTNSKRRGHTPPTYTLKEFRAWLLDNDYDSLYKAWVASGFEKDFKPSTDRLRDDQPYSFTNMQLGTWLSNRSKQYAEFVETKGKGVIQLNLEGEYINSYPSLGVAADTLGLNRFNIASVAHGNRKTAGGYRWEFEY